MTDLATATHRLIAGLPDLIQTGTITNDDPVEVEVSAQDGLPASWIRAYTRSDPPSADDSVLIVKIDDDLIVLGRIEPSGE